MFSKRLVDREIENLRSAEFNEDNCAALADLLIVKEYLFKGIPTNDTPLLKAASGKDLEKVFAVLEETMASIKALHPRLYDSTLNKIKDI